MDIYKERIKPLFDKTGLMNKDLESEIGIPEKKISDWNAGRLKSYDKYIPQIAAYFNVSTDYLLGKTDNPTPPGAPSNTSEAPVPFQLTDKAREMMDIFLSLDEPTQDSLLQYARFLTTQKANAPLPAETHLA